MLSSVIIVLKEFLEASLIISLLLILQKKFVPYRLWLAAIFPLSILGATLFSYYFQAVSEAFEGSGQEIINGALLICTSMGLALQILFTHYVTPSAVSKGTLQKFPMLSMILSLSALGIAGFSITREGAEVIIYLQGVITNPHYKLSSMIVGSVIGGGLGICIGILIFVCLYALPSRPLMTLITILLILITAGLVAEALQNFIQANLLLADAPLWDSSTVLSESSITGQLLHAIFAYEATPTQEEVLAWLITVISLLLSILYLRCRPSKSSMISHV